MKKMLLFLFICVFVTNSFANDIAANVTNPVCDNATLEKYNGTVNVEINWEPNVIDLRWYDGDTLLNVPTEAQSCVYDGDMYIPTQPTKTGYTFMGWTIKEVKSDFSTLPTNGNALEFRAVQINRYYCWYWDSVSDSTSSDNTCTSDYAHLQPYEWEVVFDWGTIYGQSVCSSTPGTSGQTGTPTTSWSDSYAWCKVTGYKPSDSDIIHKPNNDMPWVFARETGAPARACTWHNALDCARVVAHDTNFLKAILGITQ